MCLFEIRANLVLCAMAFLIGFAFFGTLLLLEPYLIEHLKLDESKAILLWSGYAGFVFIADMLGGWLGGRHLSYVNCALAGVILFALGFNTIAFNPDYLIFGLACASCGIGVMGPNLKVILGSGKAKSSWSSYTRFAWFQGATDTSKVLGLTILAVWSQHNPNAMFIGAAIASALGLILIAFNYGCLKQFISQNDNNQETFFGLKSWSTSILLILAAVPICYFSMKNDWLVYILWPVFAFIVIKFFQYYNEIGDDSEAKVKLLTIPLLMLGFLVFTVAMKFEMSTMMVFVSKHVNSELFGFTIPTKILNSADPATYLLLLIPFMYFAKRFENSSKSPKIRWFFALSLSAITLGYLIMWLATGSVEQTSAFHYLSYTMLMGVATFLMLPASMAIVNILVKFEMRGFIMASWVFVLALSAQVNKLITEFALGDVKNFSMAQYHTLFGYMVPILAGLIVLLLLLWAWWWRRHKAVLSGKV